MPVGADHSSVLGEQEALGEEQAEEGTGGDIGLNHTVTVAP